ncbi:Uncharacterised protein [Mycoplasmopsis citelli]|uniref:Uncharacterized protein n=2 Tax=Mycoplasmopsis citelli TaxID=171281 RepID=A0A449B2H3_9BACT|nr:hypothetical protein [Mycoplasmopsis citelli]VEU74792.1 Uncharacterised protein [Mycoplasmopsis citelli]
MKSKIYSALLFSKEQIQNIKEDPYLSEIISKLQISDNEIVNNIDYFLKIHDRQIMPNEYIDIIELFRDENGKLSASFRYADNAKAKAFLQNQLIKYKELGFFKYKYFFSQLKLSSLVPTNLLNHQKQFQSNIKQIKKGFYIQSKNTDDIVKIFNSIANDFVKNHVQVAYINVSNLMNYIKSTFNNPDENSELIVKNLSNISVVIFDNLGFEQLPKWFFEKLYKILEHRKMYGKITYFSSPFSLEFIAQNILLEDNNNIFIKNQKEYFYQTIKGLIEFEITI